MNRAIIAVFLVFIVCSSLTEQVWSASYFKRDLNLDAMAKRMPGLEQSCPKPSGFGHCAMLCSSDGGCPEGKKCCFNGCGYDCMSPGKY
ncbi:hypothetical protein ABFA07_017378 [Porites harrisoni]